MGDPAAGYEEYTDVVLDALGSERDDLIVVGQSMGAFTAPMVCERTPARLLVLLAQDRLFPADLIRRLATDRRNLTADELDGGHLIALGHPTDLVTRLEHYAKIAGR